MSALEQNAIAGVVPRFVHEPRDAKELSEVMRGAARDKQCIALVGGGTKLTMGLAPQKLDAVIRTRGMKRILEYAPADMVLIAEAGATLAEIQAVARAERQQLALDPPFAAQATIGGIIATADSGPRRARYGAVKDLIIGATLVRADGTLAKSGGKVVKNVAGFDLPKLVCGSLGTLAAVATATFRLHPLPERTATVLLAPLNAAGLQEFLIKVREAQLEPTCALALRRGNGWELALSFEGFEAGVREQCARLSQLGSAEVLSEAAAAELWNRHAAIRERGNIRLKANYLPSKLASLEGSLLALGGEQALYPTLGIAHVSCDSLEPTVLVAARAALGANSGSLVIQAMPPAPQPQLEPWGASPTSFTLMQQLKQSFDPERRLNRGRYVGGI